MTKLCVDCEHCSEPKILSLEMKRVRRWWENMVPMSPEIYPSIYYAYTCDQIKSLVTGGAYHSKCSDMREVGSPCGPTGKLFKAKGKSE